MQAASDRWYEDFLGQERFASFLEAAKGDRYQAIALVEWDREMRGELQKALGEWELALRNAYDAKISAWWTAEMRREEHWLIDPDSPVQRPIIRNGIDINAKTRSTIAKARGRAGATASSGQIVANLTLDFWRYLSVASREKSLWVPVLHRAFPHRSDRVKVDREIDTLYRLRNRIAHHEPIVRKPVDKLAARLCWSCEQVRPELADAIQQRWIIADLWKQRPVPWSE
jgi:hypothetical protein